MAQKMESITNTWITKVVKPCSYDDTQSSRHEKRKEKEYMELTSTILILTPGKQEATASTKSKCENRIYDQFTRVERERGCN
jgi:predicted metal-binding transcription factor (methanogenesis marker protein 9)